MTHKTFTVSFAGLSKLRLVLLSGAFVAALSVVPMTVFAADNGSLIPEDEEGQLETAPLEDDASAPKAEDSESAAAAKGTEEATAGDGLPVDSGAAAPSEDEFSFDDTVEYEKKAEDVATGFRKQAFDTALETVMPLKPEEIRSVLENYDRTVQSIEVPVHPYPRPEQTVQTIGLDPGATPLTVKLTFGYVTTISMLDQSGKPWPIEDMSWVGDFEIHEGQTKNYTHLIRISPSSNFAHGNMSMRLAGLETPIILTFETNRDVVHYRFDAIVPKDGPNSATPIIDVGPASSLTLAAGDTDMSLALGGVIPVDAERLSVSGVDGRTTAYSYNGLTYVRTPLTLLSPGWESSVASGDGMRVYALPQAPVLILSDKGKMVRAHLSESGGSQ